MMHTDYTGFYRKIETLQQIGREVLPPAIKQAVDEVQTKIKNNLEGAHYVPPARIPGIGKIPIPRVSGMLAASIEVVKIEDGRLYKIVSKGTKAYWNIYVHEGTKYQKPRRFMLIPITERRPAIHNRWKYAIMLEVRRRGLA